VLRAVVTDFFFSCWRLEISSDNSIGTCRGASAVMRKTLDWKRSGISIGSDWFEYCLVRRILLPVEGFDFRPSSR
jgi:hypothetical protein